MSIAEALATENLLAEGLDQQPVHATGLVIFGATGHQAIRDHPNPVKLEGLDGWVAYLNWSHVTSMCQRRSRAFRRELRRLRQLWEPRRHRDRLAVSRRDHDDDVQAHHLVTGRGGRE